MSSPELRELTASEPLTLEEEYQMQEKWQTDEDKLTFIICVHPGNNPAFNPCSPPPLTMIGDVNLFFKGLPGEEDFEVEAEIMIAETAFRGRGLGLKALQLMFSFAISHGSTWPLPIAPATLVARIGESNASSQRLFEKLGFVITKRVEVFEEVEMRFRGQPKIWRRGTVKPYDQASTYI